MFIPPCFKIIKRKHPKCPMTDRWLSAVYKFQYTESNVTKLIKTMFTNCFMTWKIFTTLIKIKDMYYKIITIKWFHLM